MMHEQDREPAEAGYAATYGRRDFAPEACEAAIRAAISSGYCSQSEAPELARVLFADSETTSPRRFATAQGVKIARRLAEEQQRSEHVARAAVGKRARAAALERTRCPHGMPHGAQIIAADGTRRCGACDVDVGVDSSILAAAIG